MKKTIGNATLCLCDCMDLMKQYPDKHFDLAIVDPPYGINVIKRTYHKQKLCFESSPSGFKNAKKSFYADKAWDKAPPTQDYFNELFRISKNQVIFGANHFIENINKNSSCWIFWDKMNGDNDFADGELAWCSFNSAVRKFSFRWNGCLQGDMKNKETRIHPTQKPVALYKWLLQKYAKPGWKILDTHFGSGSLAVACNELGFSLTASEIDNDYFNAACKRIADANKQQLLFREAV